MISGRGELLSMNINQSVLNIIINSLCGDKSEIGLFKYQKKVFHPPHLPIRIDTVEHLDFGSSTEVQTNKEKMTHFYSGEIPGMLYPIHPYDLQETKPVT